MTQVYNYPNKFEDLSVTNGNIVVTNLTPPTAPTVATGAAGNLNGNYYYSLFKRRQCN